MSIKEINNYSGIVGLITSLITVAYIFGSVSTRVSNLETTYMSEHQINQLIKSAVTKEREISDVKYYTRPNIEVDYLSKNEFKEYMDLYKEKSKEYEYIWKQKYNKD